MRHRMEGNYAIFRLDFRFEQHWWVWKAWRGVRYKTEALRVYNKLKKNYPIRLYRDGKLILQEPLIIEKEV